MATINLGAIKFNWKGAYNSSTTYAVDDVVSSGGNSYVCIQAHSNQAVGDATAYWNIMSAKGTNGTNGTNGTDVGTTLTTQGDILYRDGSGLQRLPKGTAGQVLQMNSGATAPEYGNVSSDFVKLATVNASSSSSLALDGHFTSDYQRYEIHASDVIPSTNTDFWYRGYTGGSEVSSNVYVNTSNYYYTDTTPSVAHGDNNAGSQDTNSPNNYFKMDGDDHYGGQPCYFRVVIHDPLNTTRHKQIEMRTGYAGNGSNGVMMTKIAMGTIRSNSALSGFAFYPSAGNITSGTFKLYGIK